ncbi:MAG: molybdopterin molybdotransferase MoeA [Mailhella sp.]|nr:molybdopterin molybdotransferase MoeA [Mailhella sp.]
MKPFLSLMSVDEILASIKTFDSLPGELIPLDDASGRYLKDDFSAPEDLPGFDRSSVDGFAVHARDVFGASESSPALLDCIEGCVMGQSSDFVLKNGQAARILTGGMLPEGADCCVMIEHSREAGVGLIEIVRSSAPGDNIVMHDEDAAKGSVLIQAGTRLRAQEIGLLAAFGQVNVGVARRPLVSIISTGDEVVPAHQKPAPGQVRDVNSHSLAALCTEAGAEPVFAGLVRDNPEKLSDAVSAALSDSDVVLVSGGSSAGMRDFTVDIFRSMPESNLIAHGAAISPGKPFILAQSKNKCLMGLPGHVASALVCAHAFLLPLLRVLQGGKEQMPHMIRATLTRQISSSQGRRDYIRARLFRGENGWMAEPLPGHSGVMSDLVRADAFIVCPENREGFYAGEETEAELLR